ncbi:unnamed protein product [Blepharisma stoltei]|uniref:Uncharacterized protein n=1 Tax=Blepharisma stoltei TaxID=1481888 RepID=A0AAU9JZ74_9CILI|nr:unnamed protein product [Blepharisma stoltei]
MEDIEKKIYDLFKYTFTTNCDIDEAPMTQEELDTLDDLQPYEILENLKDIITDLLNFKKQFKTTEAAELINRADQFEKMLQKLEADIRTHIKIEQQMKLQLDIAKSKVEEYEKGNKNAKMPKNHLKLRLDLKLGHSPKQTKEEKAVSYRENYKEIDKIKKKYEEKLQQITEESENKEKNIKQLEIELAKLKIVVEDKEKENEKIKNQLNIEKNVINLKRLEQRTIINSGYLKKKLEEKPLGILRFNSQIKDRTPIKDVKIRKASRKSLGGNESAKDSSPYGVWHEINSSFKKITMFKKSDIMSHKHFRSFSEYDRPQSLKKLAT